MEPLTRYELNNSLSFRIIDAARTVHTQIGPGYPEERYRRAIANELRRQRLEVHDRFPLDVWQSSELVELFFPDLIIEWQVIITVRIDRRAFQETERALMEDYLKASGASMGILFNFGRQQLEFERIVPG
jgi:GxxExxY protein